MYTLVIYYCTGDQQGESCDAFDSPQKVAMYICCIVYYDCIVAKRILCGLLSSSTSPLLPAILSLSDFSCCIPLHFPSIRLRIKRSTVYFWLCHGITVLPPPRVPTKYTQLFSFIRRTILMQDPSRTLQSLIETSDPRNLPFTGYAYGCFKP